MCIRDRIKEHRDTLLQLGESIGGRSASFTKSALRYSRVLTDLDLSCNLPFGNEGAIKVASALHVSGVNGVLTHLDLSLNHFHDEGAAAIAEALRGNEVLKSINLEYNKLGDEGKGAIWDAVSGRVGFELRT